MTDINKIEELQLILRNDSQNHEVRRKLAVILLDSGFNEEALSHFLYITKFIKDDGGLYYNLGIAYEKLKQFDNAKSAYIESLKLEPQAMDSMYNLGLVCIELKEYDQAIQCLEFVVNSDPQDSNSYFNIGLAYFKMNDYVNALNYFQKTIDLNDNDLYAHFYIGNIMKELGDLDGAKEHFKKVLEISPDYSWAYYNLAVINYEQNNYDLAEENLRHTIEFNPIDIESYKILIQLLAKIDKTNEAFEVFEQGLSKCGQNGDLYYLASQVCKKINDKENYINYLNEALKNQKTLSFNSQIIKSELENNQK